MQGSSSDLTSEDNVNDNNQQTDGRNGQKQPQPAAGAVSAGHGAPGNADGAVHASGVPATEELSTAASQPTAAADAAASRTAPATAPGPAVPPGAPMTGAPMTGTGKQPRKWSTRIVAATGAAGVVLGGLLGGGISMAVGDDHGGHSHCGPGHGHYDFGDGRMPQPPSGRMPGNGDGRMPQAPSDRSGNNPDGNSGKNGSNQNNNGSNKNSSNQNGNSNQNNNSGQSGNGSGQSNSGSGNDQSDSNASNSTAN